MVNTDGDELAIMRVWCSLSFGLTGFNMFKYVQIFIPRGSMVLVCMLTWLGYIDGIHVTIYIAYMDPMGYRLFFLTLIHYPHLNTIRVACTWFIDFLLTLEIMPSTNVEMSKSLNFLDSPKTIWWFPQRSNGILRSGPGDLEHLRFDHFLYHPMVAGRKTHTNPYDSYDFPYLLPVLTTLMSCSCDSVKMFPNYFRPRKAFFIIIPCTVCPW